MEIAPIDQKENKKEEGFPHIKRFKNKERVLMIKNSQK